MNLGGSATSYGYGGTGKKSCNSVYETYGEVYSSGDKIGYISYCLLFIIIVVVLI